MKTIIRFLVIFFTLTSVIGCGTVENQELILEELRRGTNPWLIDSKDYITPPSYDDCAVKTMTYEEAQGYMEKYRNNSESAEGVKYTTEQYPQGQNIDFCLHYAFLDVVREETYRGMGGYVMMYGLENNSSNRDTERQAIILPLTVEGEPYSLTASQPVVYFRLQPGFTDPCPKACDY